MKIGYDAKRLFRNYTGLGNYSRTLVSGYAALYPEDEIVLFAKRTSENIAAQEFLGEKYEVVTPSGFAPLWRQRGVSKDIKNRGIDVFHGLSHELPYGLDKSGVRTVVTMHDVCYRTFPQMFSATERAIYSVKYKHACQSADKIIAISQSTKNDVLEFFGVDDRRVEVLYQAINAQFYTEMDEAHAQQIVKKYGVHSDFMLYVGSINSRKNLLGLVRAMALLDSNSRLPLVVIGGGGAYKDECLREAEKLGVLGDIIIVEGVSLMQSLHAFYTLARVMVYPSFYEGFGLPVTEAILSKCPVITSSVSSLPEAGGSAAVYIDPGSPEQIAGAIASVLAVGDRERAEWVEGGRAEALYRFNPGELTATLNGIYTKLL